MVSASLDQTVRVWDISGEGLGDSGPSGQWAGFFWQGRGRGQRPRKKAGAGLM